MRKRLFCLILALMMVLLCGCEGISINIEFPGSKKEAESQETAAQVQQETVPVQAVPATVEGPGFNSPEEAILAYAAALQKGDVDLILSTFAIETFVENFDMAAYMKNSNTYTFSGLLPIPSSDSYTTTLNQMMWQYRIVQSLTHMYLSLGDYEYNGQMVVFNGSVYDTPEQLMEDMSIENWMGMLANMEIGKVLTFEDLFEPNDNDRKNLERQKAYLGCEDLVPLAVEINLNGKAYYLTADVACYNGRWYNCKFMGTIALYLGANALSGGLCALDE